MYLCIQKIEADFSGSTVTGDTDIVIEAQQRCGSLPGGDDGDDGDDGDGDGDGENKKIIIIGAFVLGILIILVVVLL